MPLFTHYHEFDSSFLQALKRIFGSAGGGDAVDNIRLRRIEAAVEDVRRSQNNMNVQVQEAIDAARENNTVTKSLFTLVEVLTTKIMSAEDLAAVKQLAKDTKAETAEIAAAILENTPSEGEEVEEEPPTTGTPVTPTPTAKRK